ncbi:MAG: hypothetical protein A2905_06600 [Candidatus Levybacteria bacterium RIFCSPLOWO2_01_FULL_36_10]|nr:MAG: hypothetical protein A2905_06600 [Candidatus Levybacteria bacterium RIFCSPLOWO2_01_FULL_36_10]
MSIKIRITKNKLMRFYVGFLLVIVLGPLLFILYAKVHENIFTGNFPLSFWNDLSCSGCNVILIDVDILRYDHLGIYGYKRNTTPNIDAFFKDGIIFNNQISQSSNTLPSYMSIFTSLYPQEHNVMLLTDLGLSKDKKTLAEILKSNGYSTLGIYFYDDKFNPKLGSSRGFDYFFSTNQRASEALNYLDSFKKNGKKFFMYFHPFSPHAPYLTSKEISDKFTNPNYKGKIISDPNYYLGKYSSFNQLEELFWSKVDKSNSEDIQHLIDLYDAKIFLSDQLLGNFLKEIKKNGQLDNTIVILTSDHGEEFGLHGRLFEHTQLYDEDLRVPLLIRYPKVHKKIQINALTQSIDIFPTILDFLKLKYEGNISGRSLTPLIYGYSNYINLYAISQFSNLTSIRALDWKLILNKGVSSELYDLVHDPNEKNNVIDKYQGVARILEESLLNRLGKVKYDYSIPSTIKLDEKTKQKLIKTGYF